ncbi:MAG: hypothetical protein Q8O41_01985 [Candidatus Methanoperedens sp.]|nr:hypothetical protein [Candidatus Methanoperedens sp.]
MYSLEVRESVDRIFFKLAKKNPKQMRIIDKKIKQILENPHLRAVRRRAAGDALRMGGMGAWNGGADLRYLRALRF